MKAAAQSFFTLKKCKKLAVEGGVEKRAKKFPFFLHQLELHQLEDKLELHQLEDKNERVIEDGLKKIKLEDKLDNLNST